VQERRQALRRALDLREAGLRHLLSGAERRDEVSDGAGRRTLHGGRRYPEQLLELLRRVHERVWHDQHDVEHDGDDLHEHYGHHRGRVRRRRRPGPLLGRVPAGYRVRRGERPVRVHRRHDPVRRHALAGM